MKMLTVVAAVALLAGTGLAQAQATCKTGAMSKDGKPLAGAALTSYMKKCQTDATASCNKQAMDKKLAGAAKTSFTKKCVTDAVGT